MVADRPRTRILLDGGDPDETLRVKTNLEFLDGQTTNPSYVAKNPGIQRRIAAGRRLSRREQLQEYKAIVQQISPLVGDAGVSIEVFADLHTKAKEMLEQGAEMFSWIPNAYVNYPCLPEGLRAATPFFLTAAVLGVLLAGWVFWRRLTEMRLARALERKDASLGSRLTNAVDLERKTGDSPAQEFLRRQAVELGSAAAAALRRGSSWERACRGFC